MKNKIYNGTNEHSEKYRAETFRFVGYALCTPLCINISKLLTQDPISILNENHFLLRLLASAFIAALGYCLATVGLKTMIRLDWKVIECQKIHM